ncbi:hypothetical protein UP17_17575 [Peribacillus simplex]|nr:hypothetical protein UP17_17575 [Peribacillus simplex]
MIIAPLYLKYIKSKISKIYTIVLFIQTKKTAINDYNETDKHKKNRLKIAPFVEPALFEK